MDFKQLQSFVAVVEQQSFTKAADLLYLSQPTISNHIRSLEEELATRLILRSTKSIEVTSRGLELFDAAQKILGIRDDLLSRWADDSHKIIKLGASSLPSAYILPEVLPAFNQDHPGTYFAIEQGDSEEVVRFVQDDRCHLGLIGMPVTDKNLECIPFYEDHMALIAPVSDRYLSLSTDLKGRPLSPDTLSVLLKDPIILRESGSGTRKNVSRLFDHLGIAENDLHVTARINDPESIKNLVASGLGISIISRKAAENYEKEKRLLVFDLPADTAPRNLYIIYKKDYYLKDYIRQFIKFVATYYRM